MKKLNTLIAFLLPTVILFSQNLVEKMEVDEFTGAKTIETKWVDISGGFGSNYCYARFRKIDSVIILDFKLATGKVVSVDKGQKLMLKLSNDEIVELENPEYTISCDGCGAIGLKASEAQGIFLNLIVNEEIGEKLKKMNLAKFRLYANQGYIEQEVKTKRSFDFMKAIMQVDR